MSSFPSRSRFPRVVVGFPSPSSATNSAGLVEKFAGGGVERGAGERGEEPDSGQEVVSPGVEALLAEHQSRGDHLRHLAAEDPLLAGLLDLLADGHLAPLPDQLRQVGVPGMVRHPAHRDVRFLVARGQGDVEKAGGAQGVLEEHLVEIAHAEEEDAVPVAGLDLHVLPHRGGQRKGHRGSGTVPTTGSRGRRPPIRGGGIREATRAGRGFPGPGS